MRGAPRLRGEDRLGTPRGTVGEAGPRREAGGAEDSLATPRDRPVQLQLQLASTGARRPQARLLELESTLVSEREQGQGCHCICLLASPLYKANGRKRAPDTLWEVRSCRRHCGEELLPIQSCHGGWLPPCLFHDTMSFELSCAAVTVLGELHCPAARPLRLEPKHDVCGASASMHARYVMWLYDVCNGVMYVMPNVYP